MTIAQRLNLLVATAIAILLVIAGIAYVQMNHVYEAANYGNENTVPSLLTLREVDAGFAGLRVQAYNHVLNTDDSQMAEIETRITKAMERRDKALKQFETCCVSDDRDRDFLNKEIAGFKAYDEALNKVLALSRKNQNEQAREMLANNRKIALELGDLIQQHMDYNRELGDKGAKNAQSARSMATMIAIALAVGGGLLLLIVGLRIVAGIRKPLNEVVGAATKMAEGDFAFDLKSEARDEIGEVVRAVASVQGAVRQMATDASTLVKAAKEGQLSTRADAGRHKGEYRAIVQGVNDTLDAVVGPLQVAANYVDRIARGDIPAKITDTYRGDFNTLKNNLNTCIEAVGDLVADAMMLSQAAVAGQLSTRADAGRHQGDFRKIVEGVNDTLDNVVGPLREVQRILDALAKGDLTQTIQGDYRGDFGKLQDDSNVTVERLRETVGRIKEATEAVNTAAQEISSGNVDLSQRTEEQASNLEETASSMEELSSTVKQNTDSVREANRLAGEASVVAGKGGDVVGQVVNTMRSISDSSKKIADIISVIDGIAFQTNILALNAAVEAARAGEQGRGFAVVASEVRNLAQRSATAAKEIKGLIGDSVDKVENGGRLVGEAGETMREIVSAINRVTELMNGIAAASQQQSAGIEQVSLAVTQMDDVTQQNAALVEQAAATAESLEEQAQTLAVAVSTFKLAQGQGGQRATARPALRKAAAPKALGVVPREAVPSFKVARSEPAMLAKGDDEWSEF